MYYLFLEIGSYRQLSRLEPGLIAGLVSRLTDQACRHGAVAAGEEGGRFLFRFPVLEEDRHGPILDAAFETCDILAESDEELAGFSVVVDLAGTERDSEVAARLRDYVLSAPLDGVIWLTGSAAEALGAFVETETQGPFTRIMRRRDTSGEPLGTADEFVVMPRAVEEMRDRMTPWINGEEEAGILLVYGDTLQATARNAAAAIGPLQNEGRRAYWPRIVGTPGESDPYRPLLRTVSEQDLERAGEHLSGTERAAYADGLELLRVLRQRPFAGSYHRLRVAEVQSAYTLFLTGRMRLLRDATAVPGILVEEAQTLERETVAVLTGALAALSPALRPIVVLTSTRDVLPVQLLGRDVARYEFPGFSAEEFAERATEYLSESARRQLRLAAGLARTGGKALAVFHHFSNLQEERAFETDVEHDPKAGPYADAFETIDRLARDEVAYLFIAGELAGLLDSHGLARLLGALGTESVRISQIAEDLVRRGLLRNEHTALPRAARFSEHGATTLGDRAEGLRTELAGWIVDGLRSGRLFPDLALARAVARAGRPGDAVEVMRQLLRRELDSGNLERAGVLERDDILLDPGDHPERRRRAAVFGYGATLRRLLLQRDIDEAERMLSRAPDTGDNPELVGEVALQQGRQALMAGRLPEAMRLSKRAVMAFQDAGTPDATSRAQLEFGMVLLGREQLSDARDYFLLVQGGSTGDPHTLARAELLGTLCLFLEGRYTRVLEAVERQRTAIRSRGFEEWLLYGGFLAARSLFELGRYADAATAFEQGMADARLLDNPAAFRAHHLWAARCEVYLGDTVHARSVFGAYEPDAEVLFFTAEALHRSEYLQQAFDTLEEALEQEARVLPLGGELPNWAGGFALVEDLAIGRESGEPVLRNLIRAFRGYVMAHLGRIEAAMGEVHNLTRQQQLSAIDPFRSYYYYCYSVILTGAGPDRLDDPLTVLGKSVKHMRERTARIDQYGQKTDFLYKSYWNRRLMDAAKTHNLL